MGAHMEHPASGVIFCATGERYVAMAKAAAAGIRKFDPNVPCDLFSDTDGPVEGFDQTHKVENPSRYSKIEAMLNSRFEKTLFLDADTFVVNPISDVFSLLDRFDIALVHDPEPNSPHGRRLWRQDVPASFPQYNSGVVGLRRTDAVQSLLNAWLTGLLEGDGGRDQPALRELLWLSDLRIATLPPEFNFCDIDQLAFFRRSSPAPRIVHYFNRKPSKTADITPEEVLGSATLDIIKTLSQSDGTLEKRPELESAARPGFVGKRILQVRALLEALRVRRRA